MKKTLQVYLRSLLLSGMFLVMGTSSYANHISAMDLAYTYVSSTGSGATMSSVYLVTATIYGNCSDNTGSFPTLPTSSPQVCVYNGTTLVTTLNLVEQAAQSGIKVTNVCNADTAQTTCTSVTAYTLPGIEKYVYTATVTLTGTSAVWRFIYEGYNGTGGVAAGRANNITSIVGASGSVVYLCDTLNNTAAIPYNTSTTLPIIPTPYYCLNDADTYNPGAVNALGDSLVFVSVQPRVGSGANTCSSATPGTVTYVGGYSLAAPITGATSYSFSSTTGEIAFSTPTAQVSTIDYLIREYRGGVMVGSCMREMNIKTTACTIPAPSGNMRTATNGAIISDSTTFETCQNTGTFSFTIAGIEDSTAYNIYMTASNLPTGATYTIANDSTNHPVATFTWTSTGVTPGTYSFDVLYSDNDCPVPSQSTIAYSVIIEPTPAAIGGATTVCTGQTATLTDAQSGGVWTSGNTTLATVGSSSGVISGVGGGLDPVTYSISAAACAVTATVTVTGPDAITGTMAVCPTLTTALADAVTGGVWTSSNTAVATVSTAGIVTGVGSGTTHITYTLSSTGCYVIATVTCSAMAAITPASAVLCIGNTTSLTDATSGGVWSSSSTSLATVNSGGVVGGVAAGPVSIFYTIGSCYATASVTVSATGPGAISPASPTACVGGTVNMTDVTSGGTWSSSTTGIATINTSTGQLNGVLAGAATISYFLGGCYTTTPVNVISGIAAITPAANNICPTTTVSLVETTTGGTWSSSTTTVATVGSTGTVYGVSAGTTNISYIIGSCNVINTVTVSPGPQPISPVPVTVCRGTTTALTDGTTGGTWTSSNNTVASITAGGIVTGSTVGTTTIGYTASGCTATTIATVGATPSALLPASAVLCTGNTQTLTETVTGGVWSSSNSSVASVTGGLVTGVTAGTATISYSSGSCIVTAPVTVDLAPNPGIITGSSLICTGGTTSLIDVATGGTWSSGTTSVASVSSAGILLGVSTGTALISYSVTTGCGTVRTTHLVTVDAAPSAGTISGTASVCAGTTDQLSDLTTGGTWSMTNSHATVSATSGLVTGVSPGIDTVIYTVTSGCGTVSTKLVMSVGAALSAGTITGSTTSFCGGTTISLADATTGGTWSSNNTSAIASPIGVVTGAAAGGIDTISYTVSSAFCAAVAIYPINVIPIPDDAPISGPSTLCVGSSALFTDGTADGTWSASNTNVSVSSGGLVTGVSLGTSVVSYTVSNACGTSIVTTPVTMSATASAGTITASAVSVCVGSTLSVTESEPGGVWSASNGNASVSAGGIVTALTAGADTIYYTIVTTGCGTYVASQVIAVVSTVSGGGTILGPSSVCVSSLINLTDPTVSGGVWSSSNSHATITTGGLVTGISPGTDTISYTITSSCGVASATKVITVGALTSVDPISGSPVICVGGTFSFTDGSGGGVWASENGNATVDATSGSVTGISLGTDVISYTITTTCGAVGATMAITIASSVTAGTISGPTSVCAGATITLTDAIGGGAWLAGNSDATVTGGVVTGVAAGITPISYTVTNTCGTATAVTTITVLPTASAGTISGSSSVCIGSLVTLTDATSGGAWTASNANAAITGTGIVEGITPGIDTVYYTVSNSCGTSIASKILSIHTVPVVDPIAGPTTQCAGTLILLTDVTSGGSWSSSNTSVATINATTGVITGVSTGYTTLTYNVANSYGCPSYVTSTDAVTGGALPPISGSLTTCEGTTTALSDLTGGGVWTSANTAVAAINSVTGVITGVSIGTALISYTDITSCGTSFITRVETIITAPTITAISGATSICAGSSITLTHATSGGVWSSSNTAVATAVAATGAVTGVSPGTTTISYTYGGGCSVTVSTIITVASGTAIAAIAGTTHECIGTSTSLSDGTSGGVWSSSNAAVAGVSTGGAVSGVAAGTAIIYYTVAATGCSSVASVIDTVLAIPVETPITGAATICAGTTLTLSNITPDGAWSSGNAAIAAVNALTGVVTGVSGGTARIYYTISDVCGSALDSVSITISAAPTVSAISAAFTSLCAGTTVSLTDAGTGGTWSSSNAAVATVSSTGVVTGVAAGTDIVSYTVRGTDGCTNSAGITLTIGGSILSGSITPGGSVTLCHGHTVTMDIIIGSGTGISYQWLLGGGAIAGATNETYTATSIGSYSAEISNGGCSEIIGGPSITSPPNPVISFRSPATLFTGTFVSYKWFLNGALLPGDVGSSISISGAGTYKVVVTDANGCSDTSGGYIVTAPPPPGTGVSNVTNPQDIKVYPNPTTSTLFIDAPINVNVAVLSIDGKTLISKSDVTSIDVSALSDGLYMIMVYDENNLLLKASKFVKVQ